MSVAKQAAVLLCTLTSALFVSSALAEDKPAADSAAIAVVNGVAIPKDRYEMVIQSQVAQGQKDTPDMRSQIKDVMITRELLTQEALKLGIDKTPEYNNQLEISKQDILLGAFFTDFKKRYTPSDAEMQAEYDRAKGEQGQQKKTEFHVRHILLKTEAEAKKILEQMKKNNGATMEKIAKEKSTDEGSKAQGGLLEWTDGQGFVKEFAAAVNQLKKGEYTKAAIKTQYGYHIIKLEDQRSTVIPFPGFEQVKQQIENSMLAKKRDEMITDLRAKAKIE
jgi:peptidyl-prolyl cis-trans isomerase C